MNQALLTSILGFSLFGCANIAQQVPPMDLAVAQKVSAAIKPAEPVGDKDAFGKLIALVDGVSEEIKVAVNTSSGDRVAGQKAMLVAVGQEFEGSVRVLVEGEPWLLSYPDTAELQSDSSRILEQLAKVKEASKLLGAYADVVEEGGNPELAARACLTNRKLSLRMLEASNLMMTELVGVAVSSIAERNIRDLALRGSWTEADIKSLQGHGAVKFGAIKGLQSSIMSEWWNYSVPSIATLEFPVKKGTDFGISKEMLASMEMNPKPFDREATLKAGATYLTMSIEEMTKNPLESKGSDAFWDELFSSFPGEEANETEMSKWCKTTPNVFGLVSLQSVMPIFAQARVAAIRQEASRGLTEVVLAARRGMIESGALPGSYSELKKFGLPDDVNDPYSGKAFGYDAKRGLAWSVGPDKVDGGGKNMANQWSNSAKDFVVKLK